MYLPRTNQPNDLQFTTPRKKNRRIRSEVKKNSHFFRLRRKILLILGVSKHFLGLRRNMLRSTKYVFVRACRSISDETQRNHGTSGPATAGQLLFIATSLSICVLHQSASTVPCCMHVVLPLTRSTKPRSADQAILFKQTQNKTDPLHSLLQQTTDYSRKVPYVQ